MRIIEIPPKNAQELISQVLLLLLLIWIACGIYKWIRLRLILINDILQAKLITNRIIIKLKNSTTKIRCVLKITGTIIAVYIILIFNHTSDIIKKIFDINIDQSPSFIIASTGGLFALIIFSANRIKDIQTLIDQQQTSGSANTFLDRRPTIYRALTLTGYFIKNGIFRTVVVCLILSTAISVIITICVDSTQYTQDNLNLLRISINAWFLFYISTFLILILDLLSSLKIVDSYKIQTLIEKKFSKKIIRKLSNRANALKIGSVTMYTLRELKLIKEFHTEEERDIALIIFGLRQNINKLPNHLYTYSATEFYDYRDSSLRKTIKKYFKWYYSKLYYPHVSAKTSKNYLSSTIMSFLFRVIFTKRIKRELEYSVALNAGITSASLVFLKDQNKLGDVNFNIDIFKLSLKHAVDQNILYKFILDQTSDSAINIESINELLSGNILLSKQQFLLQVGETSICNMSNRDYTKYLSAWIPLLLFIERDDFLKFYLNLISNSESNQVLLIEALKKADSIHHSETRERVIQSLADTLCSAIRSSPDKVGLDRKFFKSLNFSAVSGKDTVSSEQLVHKAAFKKLFFQSYGLTAYQTGTLLTRLTKNEAVAALLYNLFYKNRSHRQFPTDTSFEYEKFLDKTDYYRETPIETSFIVNKLTNKSSNISHFVCQQGIEWLIGSLTRKLSINLLLDFQNEIANDYIRNFDLLDFIIWHTTVSEYKIEHIPSYDLSLQSLVTRYEKIIGHINKENNERGGLTFAIERALHELDRIKQSLDR